MKRKKLNISVSKNPEGVISCKTVPIKKRLMDKLFGGSKKMIILVPGEMVNDITISEVTPKTGGSANAG